MQVFYVNIGGGEPTVRPGLLGAARLRHRPRRRREVLHQRRPDHAGQARPRSWRRRTTSTSRSPSTARPPRSTTHVRGAGLVRHRDAGDGEPGRGRASASFKISVVCTRHNVDQLDEFKAIADQLRRAAAAHPAAPLGPRRRRVGRAAPDCRRSSAQLYDWLVAHGEEVLTGDSFFHLVGLRRGAARAEPVRRRAGGVPDRPGRRRLRLPVRDPRRVPGRQRPLARRLRTASGSDSELFAELRQPQTGGACASCSAYDSCQGGCMAAKFFTGLPLDGPDPECVRGFGEQALAARSADTPIPKSEVDHSRSAPRNGRDAEGAGAAGALGPPTRRQARPGLRREPAGRGRAPGAAHDRRSGDLSCTCAAQVADDVDHDGRALGRAGVARDRRPADGARARRVHRAARPAPAAGHGRAGGARPSRRRAAGTGTNLLVAPPVAYGASGRARGVPRHGVDRARGPAAAARRAGPFGRPVGRPGDVRQRPRRQRPDARRRGPPAALRGPRRRLARLRPRRRRPRGPDRDVADARAGPRARRGPSGPPATRPRWATCCPRCAPAEWRP